MATKPAAITKENEVFISKISSTCFIVRKTIKTVVMCRFVNMVNSVSLILKYFVDNSSSILDGCEDEDWYIPDKGRDP